MKTLPIGLAGHLAGQVTTLARCWKLTRLDGNSSGYTDHDVDIAFDGTTYSAMDGMSSTGDVAKAGFAVGGLEVEGALSSTGLLADDLNDGRFDGAEIEFYLVNWADPSQRTLLRIGTLGVITRSDEGFKAEVRGPMQKLETIRGRVFASTCDADLGDTRCGVDLGVFAVSAVVNGASAGSVTASGLEAYDTGWFSGGVVIVETGKQAGRRFGIGIHTQSEGHAVFTLRPHANGFAAGDTLLVTPGCDKRFSTCSLKYSNASNFRGFPHMPGNDRALGYARSSV